MRYFDLRSFLPQHDQPSTEALVTFERIPAGEPAPPPDVTGEPILPSPARQAEVVDLLSRANLAADRRSCPDLLAQLRAAATGQTKIDTILCTLLDGDATLRLNAALAARFPDEILAGLDFLDTLLAPKRSWLVTDVTAPANWLAAVRAAARLTRRRVVPMRNDYPESDPSLLLFTLLNRRLKPGRLPTDVNTLLLDAPAAISLARFARTAAAPTTTWVAVHHPDWPATRYADVPVNTPLSAILSHMGLRAEDYVVRAGDLLRDHKVSPDTRVAAGELTFHVHFPERPTSPDPCIRCGWCVEGCPVRIHPAGILEAAQRNSLPLARHYGLDSCIECGICSYVCPSHLPLLPGIRHLRQPNPTPHA